MTIINGMKLQLDKMREIDALFGSPSKAFPTIHVAGTNGKGSVTTKIASSLALKGARVGLFTSPHISTWRERIRINGEKISEEEGQTLWKEMERKGVQATFFEWMTLLAFLHFARQRVDIAVIEVGMGGRLDATNIITPLLSIITTIEWDHTRYLGTTLEEIAQEKAGIIKPGVPTLTGPKAASFPIFQRKSSSYHTVEGQFDNYEEENRAIAKRALELLPFPYDFQGLETTPACRFERFEKEVTIILDVAHNPGGFCALFSRLQGEKIHLLMGLGEDKEIEQVVDVVMRHARFVHLTQADTPRAASCEQLAAVFLKAGYKNISLQASVEKAFQEARRKAFEEKAVLCVCGTFYIMSRVRKELGILEPCDEELMTPY